MLRECIEWRQYFVRKVNHLCLSWRATDGRTRFKAASKCLEEIHTGAVTSSSATLLMSFLPIGLVEDIMSLALSALCVLIVTLEEGADSVLEFTELADTVQSLTPRDGWLLFLIISLTTASPASLTKAARSAPLKQSKKVSREEQERRREQKRES